MKYIDIVVSQRHASYNASRITPVCGNKDYIVRFAFDDEWTVHDAKTARFITEDGYQDVLFTGNECEVPQLVNVRWVRVGVYAGDLHTTTPAYVRFDQSVLCGDNPVHPEPPVDIYNQLLDKLDAIEKATVSDEAVQKAVAAYMKENPIETDETLFIDENGALSVNVTDKLEQDNTLPISSAAVHATVGNIGAILDTI